MIVLASSPLSDSKVHAIGILGFIAQLQESVGQLPQVGAILKSNLNPSSSPLVVAETLQSLFDIFAVARVNQVFHSLDLLPFLSTYSTFLWFWFSWRLFLISNLLF